MTQSDVISGRSITIPSIFLLPLSVALMRKDENLCREASSMTGYRTGCISIQRPGHSPSSEERVSVQSRSRPSFSVIKSKVISCYQRSSTSEDLHLFHQIKTSQPQIKISHFQSKITHALFTCWILLTWKWLILIWSWLVLIWWKKGVVFIKLPIV